MPRSVSRSSSARTASSGPETTDRAGAFDRRQRELLAEERHDLLFGQRHGQHRTRRQRLHQAAAGGDQSEGVVEREDPGQAGRHVLADRVAEHRLRREPPFAPEPGERVLDDEQGGLGDQRLIEPPGGLLRLLRRRVEQIA